MVTKGQYFNIKIYKKIQEGDNINERTIDRN